MTNGNTPSGWYVDPTGQGDARFWNGTSWTQAVDRNGQQVNIPIDPTLAQQAPIAGTQVQLPPPPAAQPAPSSGGSSGGVIIVLVIALLLVAAIVIAAGSTDSSTDTPPDGTEEPAPPEDAPAEDAPADDG